MSSPVLQRSFLPLFMVQFLGALNDNVFKNAMVMLITFRLADSGEQAGLLITAAAGLFILPFFLFSALAGQIADHYPKTWLIRKIKLIEILLMMTGAWAFWSDSMPLLFTVLFLMGAQSAFFGPIKYSILPEVLQGEALVKGNAWFSGSTFIAILFGTILGGWAILQADGADWVAIMMLSFAVLGYFASLWMPMTVVSDSSVEIKANFICSTWKQVQGAKVYPQALVAVLAISWFWFLGAVYLSQMPVLVKEYLGGGEDLVLIYLTIFSVGIALGSAWASRAYRAQPIATLADVKASVYWLTLISVMMLVSNQLLLLAQPEVAVGIGLGLIALLGGRYIVPLYTLMQTATEAHFRARMVAVNNILNAFLMVLSSVAIMAGYAFELDLTQMLIIIAALNLFVALWLRGKTQNESI